MNEFENPVLQVLDAYKKAVYDRDIEAFMRLYDPAVRIFDTWGVWMYEGAAAWRKMAEGWFSSLGSERVRVTVEDLAVIGSSDMILATAVLRFAGLSAEGVELRFLQNRLTLVLKPKGNDWTIVHEHTSSPIAFDHMKAVLHRDKSD
ncbi:MAG: YybH family protein [Phycisphaerales bacterium]